MFRKKLRDGSLDDKEIELEVADTSSPFPMMEIPGQPGMGMGAMDLGSIFGKAIGGRSKRRRMSVAASYELLITEEADKLLDQEAVRRAPRSRRWSRTASSFSTRSTRSAPAPRPVAPTSAARGCSATCCR